MATPNARHGTRDANDYPDEAPINHRGAMRQEIDAFRNLRVVVPATRAEALRLAANALEYYEHAIEWEADIARDYYAHCANEDAEREKVITALMGQWPDGLEAPDLGPVSKVKSRSAAKEVCELTPHMAGYLETKRDLADKKAEAEKELSVARRRHATAVAFLFAKSLEPETVTLSGGGPLTVDTMADLIEHHATRATAGELIHGPAPERGDADDATLTEPR